ncbi:hypothetical protein FRC08_012554 [Ceratobasidium sp. 394]|nr:hypothetical protein FRC08_012554 [Ceratobasidium sp. 394]
MLDVTRARSLRCFQLAPKAIHVSASTESDQVPDPGFDSFTVMRSSSSAVNATQKMPTIPCMVKLLTAIA